MSSSGGAKALRYDPTSDHCASRVHRKRAGRRQVDEPGASPEKGQASAQNKAATLGSEEARASRERREAAQKEQGNQEASCQQPQAETPEEAQSSSDPSLEEASAPASRGG